MRKSTSGLLALVLASGIGVSVSSQVAIAAPPADTGPSSTAGVTAAGANKTVASDELPNPAEEKRRALREEAITQVLNGQSTPVKSGGSSVVKVGRTTGDNANAKSAKTAKAAKTKDQYVELAREKTDKIFVILAEFGNERHPSYPDQDTDPNTAGPATFDGPLHNAIPEPDRTKDNSTIWQPDYSADYYRQLYFGKGKNVESSRRTTRPSPLGATASTVRSPTGSRSATTRPATAAPTASPAAATSAPTPGTWSATGSTSGSPTRRPVAQPTPDQGRAGQLRPVGPQRLRRRRQLQRAGRLHRPLPDRALRRRPGRR